MVCTRVSLVAFTVVDHKLPILQLAVLPNRLTLLLFVGGNTLACFLLETWVARSDWIKRVWHVISRKSRPRNQFKIIMSEMEREDWPPLTNGGTPELAEQEDIRPGVR